MICILFWVGNTPLHLAMESGHAEVAVMLIEAGADRDRVSTLFIFLSRNDGTDSELVDERGRRNTRTT